MSPLEVPTRIPPHNLDAERAVLGAVLMEGRDTLPRVIEVLRPSDFYTEAHRVIYGSMLTLFDRGEPVDVLTLTEELRRGDQLEFVGGPAALALLVEQGSISAYLSSYTSIVRSESVTQLTCRARRRLCPKFFVDGPRGDRRRLLPSELSDVVADQTSALPPGGSIVELPWRWYEASFVGSARCGLGCPGGGRRGGGGLRC